MSTGRLFIIHITYLLYLFFFGGLLYGGIGYAVFVLGHSGWWLMTLVFVKLYSPAKWRCLYEQNPLIESQERCEEHVYG